MTRGEIEARQAGREAAATVQDLWRDLPPAMLNDALAQLPGVGDEFAIRREQSRQRREAMAGRMPRARRRT